jgi:mRNA interferase RelE/StbE
LQLEGLYVARRGDYRVVYAIDDDAQTVVIVRVGHRRDVYRA